MDDKDVVTLVLFVSFRVADEGREKKRDIDTKKTKSPDESWNKEKRQIKSKLKKKKKKEIFDCVCVCVCYRRGWRVELCSVLYVQQRCVIGGHYQWRAHLR